MRHAAVDVAGEFLPIASRVLADHGLSFLGSLNRSSLDTGDVSGKVRLVVGDEFDRVLPEQCRHGWWLVRVTFRQERYGEQTITKVEEIILEGELLFGANGEAKIVMREAA